MKKLSLFLSLLLVVSLMFSFAGNGKYVDFDVTKDGKIICEGVEYKNAGEYYKSEHFKKRGKRCKAISMAVVQPNLDAIMASTADCTKSLTIIQNEYWPTNVLTVPIVFHIIYKRDGTGNIPDSRIYNQVQILNEDYGAIAGTLGANGFNTKIQFELAGITRTENDLWFRDKQESRYKGALGWDQTRYANVYVNSASGYLGYSYFPQDMAGQTLDGVVLFYDACGGRDEGMVPYDQGRTLVHELGHYFGLYHTFQSGCGTGYTAGDLIVDTNPEETAHYDCVQTYTCGSADPIHNYMNYTDDLCMYQFTSEQANRAVCGLINYRPLLYY